MAMEEKKRKEIEARLNKLLKEEKKAQDSGTTTVGNALGGVEVIRRRKGHSDLHIA